MSDDSINVQIGKRMMDAINARDFAAFDELMTEDFVAHQYGISLDMQGREAYKQQLIWAVEVFDMKANIEIMFSQGDRTVTRVTLSGKHVGNFLGRPPTGTTVEWTTIETYRLENGKLKECWAIDDMWRLLTQLGVKLPS